VKASKVAMHGETNSMLADWMTTIPAMPSVLSLESTASHPARMAATA
jgi:hypothetical protein